MKCKVFRNCHQLSDIFFKAQESSRNTIQGLESYIRSNTKLELVFHEVIDLVSRIEICNSQYEEYTAYYDEIQRDTLENFATGIIEDSPFSVKGMLQRIQSLLGGPSGNEFRVLGNRGLLELIADDMKASLIYSFADEFALVRALEQALF